MIHIYNFNDDSKEFDIGNKNNTRCYGGRGGKKIPAKINNDYYLIKMPNNLQERKNRVNENIEIEYNNSPLNEYIGSHIYNIIGMETHETFLGFRNNHIAVACKDFRKDGVILQHFSDIKVSFYKNDIKDENTNGNGSHLSSILNVIRNAELFKNMNEDIEFHFWKMFIVDYFIGNIDRNNGNWGVLNDEIANKKQLTPIFDNGNCLNNLLSDRQLKMMLDNNCLDYKLEQQNCFFVDDNNEPIKMFDKINEAKEEKLKKAIIEIVPKINLDKINEMIDEIPYPMISEYRVEGYKKLLKGRKELYLEPLYNKIVNNNYKKILTPEQIKSIKFQESQLGDDNIDKPPTLKP